MKKMTGSSLTQTIAQIYFLKAIILFHFHQMCFKYTYHFITQNVNKICTQGSRFNKIHNFYCCMTQRFFKKQYIDYGRGMHSSYSAFTHAISLLFLNPQPLRYGEGKATWPALHCLFHLAAQGPLEWLSSGLGTSSINSEKKTQTYSQAMDQSLDFGAPEENPSFSVWSGWLLPWGFSVMLYHYQMSLGGFRGL